MYFFPSLCTEFNVLKADYRDKYLAYRGTWSMCMGGVREGNDYTWLPCLRSSESSNQRLRTQHDTEKCG